MCLLLSVKQSQIIYNEWEKQGLKTVTGWKIVHLYLGKIDSLYYYHDWKVGVNESDARGKAFPEKKSLWMKLTSPIRRFLSSQSPYLSFPVVNNGIHVYLDHVLASDTYNTLASKLSLKLALMKIECPIDQFLGCRFCETEAAFKQVVLAQEEYDRLQGKIKTDD